MQNNLTHWDYAEEFSIEQIAALVVAQSEPPKPVLDRVLRAWNTAKTALFFKMVPSLQAIEGDALFSVQQLRFIRDFGQDAKAQPPLEDWQQARFTRPEIARWLRDTGLPSAYPFAPAETAQEQQAPPPAPVQQAATKNGLRRQDLLTPLINKAVQEAGEGASAPQVFAILREWVDQKRAPLIGATEEGLQWIDSSDRAKILSLGALRKRLKRAA